MRELSEGMGAVRNPSEAWTGAVPSALCRRSLTRATKGAAAGAELLLPCQLAELGAEPCSLTTSTQLKAHRTHSYTPASTTACVLTWTDTGDDRMAFNISTLQCSYSEGTNR